MLLSSVQTLIQKRKTTHSVETTIRWTSHDLCPDGQENCLRWKKSGCFKMHNQEALEEKWAASSGQKKANTGPMPNSTETSLKTPNQLE